MFNVQAASILFLADLTLNVTVLSSREGEQGVVAVRAQNAQPSRIRISFKYVQLLRILCKCINLYHTL